MTLGPDWAFETGNLGRLTRRVPASRVVTAIPARTRRAKRPKPPKEPRTPPVVEMLRKALERRQELDSRAVANQADIARREGLTRARVTQIMGMLRLAPEIRDHILSMPETIRRPMITERALRPIAQLDNPIAQLADFKGMLEEVR